jgi:hypothetical protein
MAKKTLKKGTRKAKQGRSNTASQQVFPEELNELVSRPDELPDTYDETRVVSMAVGPYLMHVYWNITPDDFRKIAPLPGEEHQSVLRFYDVTYIMFDGTNAHSFFDVPIDLEAKNWNVPLWSPEKSYVVEIGYKTQDGVFVPIAASEATQTPPAGPTPKGEELFMRLTEDGKQEFFTSSAPQEGAGPDLVEMLDQSFAPGISSKR